MNRPALTRTGLLAPTLFLTMLVALVGCGQQDEAFDLADVDSTETAVANFRYQIPAGTGAAIDDGERVSIMPSDLRVRVGDILEITNDDDRGHTIGPFFVGAGEVLRQEFTSPGRFEGLCTIDPDGEIVVTVVADES